MAFSDLHDLIAPVCPVLRINGLPSDKSTWSVVYADFATDDQRATAQSVIDACSADAPPVRARTGRAIRYALNALKIREAWEVAASGQAKVGKPDDADYWATLGAGDSAPENNPKMVRIAAAASPPISLKALYDAASTQN